MTRVRCQTSQPTELDSSSGLQAAPSVPSHEDIRHGLGDPVVPVEKEVVRSTHAATLARLRAPAYELGCGTLQSCTFGFRPT